MTLKNSKKEADWGQTPQLTPEQIIIWLESHRELMHEVWQSNPGTRERWESINLENNSSREEKGN